MANKDQNYTASINEQEPQDAQKQGGYENTSQENSITVDLNPYQRQDDNPLTTKKLEEPPGVKLEEAIRVSENLFRGITGSLQELFDILINSLRELAADERDPFDSHLLDVLSNLRTLVLIIRKLQMERSWDRDLCVSFISGFLHRMVNEKAGAFQDFVDQAHCELKFNLRAANITDLILSQHMKKMEETDCYDVISDLSSWQDDQLLDFRKQTGLAVARGVKIRRVFNLMKLPTSRFMNQKQIGMLEQYFKILEQHFQDSQTWNVDKKDGYEVRVFTHKDFDKLKIDKPQLIADKGSQIEAAHFGVFSHKKEGQRTVVEYQVTSDNLSEMILWKNPTHIEGHLEIFKAVWQATPKRTLAEIPNLSEMNRSQQSRSRRRKQRTKRFK